MKAIDQYLDDNFRGMTRPEYETLSESQKTLLRVSAFMTAVAVGLSIEQMADDAAELVQVIAEAKESLAQLEAVGRGIRIAARLVDLATAIMAKDPGAIFKAANNLRELL